MKQKILLDTDIGSDIDDAICLAYLLSNPECDLLGITTVTGMPGVRAKLASVLCIKAGKDIPIIAGADKPLKGEFVQKTVGQENVLKKYPHKKEFDKISPEEFIKDIVVNNPGEVTLLCIGPLTNIARVLKKFPEVSGLLKKIVIMSGVFKDKYRRIYGKRCEWNILNDPYSADIVYSSKIKVHKTVPLDVTLQVRMDRESVIKRFNMGLLKVVLDFATAWFKERNEVIFHDVLAGAVIFDERICEFEKGDVKVWIEKGIRGLTGFRKSKSGCHEVAFKVDKERFFNNFFSKF